MSFFKRIFFAVSLLFIANIIHAEASFVAQNIRIEGLQKISLDTVKSYLPVKEGDRIDSQKTQEIIRTLYKTGFFSNVVLAEQGNTLVIRVTERAVIGSIDISGNKEITKKQLLDALKTSGFNEGQPFDDAVLNGLRQALLEQYYSLGYYNVTVTTKVGTLERGRVAVKIQIDEGAQAKIKDIKIFGNHVFKTSKLLDNFSLTTTKLWSFITHSDQYSKEKLDADLESLKSFYLDHGYLKFKVDSANASMSPDKKNVYIAIYITEGPQFTISGWDLEGNLLGKGDEIRKLITLRRGDVFSRKAVIDINNAIGRFVGDYGYAMPNIQSEPSIDERNQQIFIHFHINPLKRVYVREINFFGNTKTREEVLRREMRQQEGALYSVSKIEESRRRLNNLGFIQDVDVKTEPVPDYSDQVDLNFNVKEASSANATAQIGYSDTDKFIYGANIAEQNFLGTGKAVGVQFTRSSYSTGYSLSYIDPYFTKDNVSMDVEAYSQFTTPNSINLSSYDYRVYGASAIFGIPISDYNRLNLGYGLEHTAIGQSASSPSEVRQFIDKYGSSFNNIKLIGGWSYNKLDRAIFPTKGPAHNFNVEIGIPIGSKSKLEYYKATYDGVYYQPLYKRSFILRLSADLGYGNGYSSMKDLPFFKNYYAGGIGSVRGFQGNTLGPRDSGNNPIGGNVLTDASVAVIFPNPFETLRTSVFIDAGNVFYRRVKFSDIKTSAGIQAEWRSPLGMVLTFSLAKPFNKKTGDRLDAFQFNLGASL